jgi:hypothetical protein
MDNRDELIAKLEELVVMYERIFETDTLDLPKTEKIKSEIASLKAEVESEYLAECIKKAEPNLSKIKDVDKELAEIRGESQITDSDIEAWAKKGIYGDLTHKNAWFKGRIEGAKWAIDEIIKRNK